VKQIVMINGIEYVPKVEVKPMTDLVTANVLKVLTEMRYFGQSHKMHSLAYDAIYAISPDLANMDPDDAFRFVRNDH